MNVVTAERPSLGQTKLADPRAPWRQYPATPKQAEVLCRRGMWRPGLTRGEASDLIASGRRG
jgi:hypothetical protein